MPPKRAAVASQAFTLSQESSYDEVLDFLLCLLTPEQYNEVSDAVALAVRS